MTLTVNGEQRSVPDGATLAEYLDVLNLRPQMVVAELNGTIVPRESYENISLLPDDTLELVQMMAGGC